MTIGLSKDCGATTIDSHCRYAEVARSDLVVGLVTRIAEEVALSGSWCSKSSCWDTFPSGADLQMLKSRIINIFISFIAWSKLSFRRARVHN
jgi:hypothetical protein